MSVIHVAVLSSSFSCLGRILSLNYPVLIPGSTLVFPVSQILRPTGNTYSSLESTPPHRHRWILHLITRYFTSRPPQCLPESQPPSRSYCFKIQIRLCSWMNKITAMAVFGSSQRESKSILFVCTTRKRMIKKMGQNVKQ